MFNRFSYELGPVSTASVFISSKNNKVGAFIKRHSTIARGFEHKPNKEVRQFRGDTSDNLMELDESLSFKSSMSEEFMAEKEDE